MNINAIQGSIGIGKAQELQRPEQVQAAPQEQASAKKPQQAPDEYTPEDKADHAPIGLYRVVQEDGAPKVEFDDPEKAPEPEKEARDVTTMDTGKVDREIKRLKEKQEKLSQQIGREQDPAKKEQLERELSQVERELAKKDNDTYRRQHAVVT